MIKAVIFDMDGVLCDSEPMICEAAVQMFARKYRTAVQDSDFIPFVGRGENRYIGGVAEQYGITLDLEADKKLTYDIYLEIIQGRLKAVHGAVDFVALCRVRGLRTAIATSADLVKLHGNLAEIHLGTDAFDAIITGSDVTRKKPAPDIFLKAAEKLGVSATDALVVEDATAGCEAARAAGCKCLGLTTSFTAVSLRESGADWTAPDFDQLPAEVRALWNGAGGLPQSTR